MTHTKHHWQYGTENEGYFIANGELRPDIAKQIQSEADARLIAAAPDLLEVVKQMQSALSRCFGAHGPDEGDRHRALAQARAAIAKATGEQS